MDILSSALAVKHTPLALCGSLVCLLFLPSACRQYSHISIRNNGLTSSLRLSGRRERWAGQGWVCTVSLSKVHVLGGRTIEWEHWELVRGLQRWGLVGGLRTLAVLPAWLALRLLPHCLYLTVCVFAFVSTSLPSSPSLFFNFLCFFFKKKILLCMCMSMQACVHECVCMHACACVCLCMHVCVRTCPCHSVSVESEDSVFSFYHVGSGNQLAFPGLTLEPLPTKTPSLFPSNSFLFLMPVCLSFLAAGVTTGSGTHSFWHTLCHLP